jgi:F0F1-type ATP synthase membrane subunit c/vacuolar-type H+-ATPase subunit K
MQSIEYDVSFYCFALATAMTLLVGVVYAFRQQVMPYHLKALDTTWDEIDPKYQFMLRALLNGGGFYGISSGLFMSILLWIPFRDEQVWAGYAIGLVGLVGAIPLGYIVYSVKKNTAGDPPLWVMVVLNILLIVGLFCLVI